MPVSFPYLRFIVVTLSALLLMSGCFRFAGPDVGVRELRDQTEKHSLRQAELAFLRADYATAEQSLNRFLRIHPQSSRSLEARWWLARVYQKTGKLSSAVEHFRVLANTRTWNLYQADARFRAAQLEELLGESIASGARKGILVSLGSVQMPGHVDSVLSASKEIEGDMILLDVPCRIDGDLSDNPQPFSFDALHSAVQHMHAQGTAVYLGVTLRCLGQFVRERELENWKDWAYDPPSGTLRRSSYYSLHFWGYQAFLADWLARLRDLPLRGLVLRNAVPVGLYEGFSPLSVQLFAQEFGMDFDPVRMFNDDRTMLTTDSESGVHLPAVFWKWAGWKARERLRIVQSLVRTLRVRLPHLEFGITLQPQSVTAPIRGLIYFAEDWVDVARGPFDMFVIGIEGSDPTVVHPPAQGSPRGFSVSSDGNVAVGEMAQHLGKPERIWTILPSPAVPTRTQSAMFPKEVGRIYEYREVP